MSKKDCKIIEDLLPNYIDGITNNETNKFIKEHLSKCQNCTEIYKNMTKDIEVDKVDIKEIDYLKKIKRNFRLGTVLIVINILIVVLFINFFFSREQKILLFSNKQNSMLVTERKYEVESNIEENIKTYYIFDENDKCITTFEEITSNSQEYLEKKYLELKESKEKESNNENGKSKIIKMIEKRTKEISYINLKYENEKITYSTNVNDNVKKDKIKAFSNPKFLIEEY